MIKQGTWTPFEGATLLIPSGPTKHLFVVLTEPCDDGMVAIVNFTTIREGVYHDKTCTVGVGEHSFINSPSYIFYEFGRVVTSISLVRGVASGDYIPRTPVSAELFERICDGAVASDDAPQKLVSYLTARFAVR